MLIVVIALVAAWIVLNVGLLGAVALANRAGQRRAERAAPAPRLVAVAPVRSLSSAR